MRDNSTILHRLQLWAYDQPHQGALYHLGEDQKWRSISVSETWLQVVRFAVALQEFGLKPQARVMIYALNSPEWIHWELATWLAGGISVGVHPHVSGPEIKAMVEQTDPQVILVESEIHREKIIAEFPDSTMVFSFQEALSKLVKTPVFDDALLYARGELLLKKIKLDLHQMIVFTSGVTGVPKGVMLGLKQLTFVADTLTREWNLPYMEGHLFSFLPLAHIAEKIQSISVAITQRYPVWFNSRFDRFLPELKEVRPTLLLAVPRIWERFREQVESQKPKLLQRMMEIGPVGQIAERVYLSQVKEQLGLDRLKLAVSGASKLPPPIGDWFKSIGVEIQEIYGMSESAGLTTLTHRPRRTFRDVGVSPVGVEVKIASDGEIWVKGPQVFFGYWKDEAATNEILLPDGWLKTGDLGEWTPELEIIGRNRDIIKLSSGRMLAPSPIEDAMKEIPEISNVCLVGEGRPYPLALVTLKENVLLEVKFSPGAIEGMTVEDEGIRKRIYDQIEALVQRKKITEKIRKIVILSRDFSIEQGELTSTQKLNRGRIQKNFRYFLDLKFEE